MRKMHSCAFSFSFSSILVELFEVLLSKGYKSLSPAQLYVNVDCQCISITRIVGKTPPICSVVTVCILYEKETFEEDRINTRERGN